MIMKDFLVIIMHIQELLQSKEIWLPSKITVKSLSIVVKLNEVFLRRLEINN